MSNPDKDLLKTKQFLTSMELRAKGWNSRIVSDAVIDSKGIYLYVMDLPTGWVWVSQLSCESFKNIISLKPVPDVEVVRSTCAGLIVSMAEGEDLPPYKGVNKEELLTVALSHYATGTQTWKLTGEFEAGGHFFVLHYRQPKETSGLLRPFAMVNETGIIPAEQVSELFDDVIAQDRIRHPDWFA